ncbi:MAG: AraC family transcriptional regulator [Verrucomicrobiaceae bacterium]|nr:AraC family transcriptional regulator [Verrucomicrobiaceae bacterium]
MHSTSSTDPDSISEALFDALPDVVFFVKDRTGRYMRVNQTFADRCASGDKARLVGRLPSEVFPADLAVSYARQDATVISTGRRVDHQLELHIYPGGRAGWCLTTKIPVKDKSGAVCGVAGISRDLNAPGSKPSGMAELASAMRFIKQNFKTSIRIEDVARLAGLSVYQLEQRTQKIFQLSPLQLIHRMRLDEATRMLRETKSSLADIAFDTGWCDQSAFTRHFSRYVGMSPGRYRALQAAKK